MSTSFAMPITPKCFNFTVEAGGLPHTVTFDGTAVSLTIITDPTEEETFTILSVKLNDDDDAVFYLNAGDVLTFHNGDLHIKSIEFASYMSGANNIDIQMIAGVVV